MAAYTILKAVMLLTFINLDCPLWLSPVQGLYVSLGFFIGDQQRLNGQLRSAFGGLYRCHYPSEHWLAFFSGVLIVGGFMRGQSESTSNVHFTHCCKSKLPTQF